MQNLLSRKNLKAASLALLLFVYPILVLSTFSFQYTETVHRITTVQKFDMSLFGSHLADALAAIGLLLLFNVLSFRSSLSKIVALVFFGGAVAAFVGGYDQLIVVGLVTVPLVAGFLLTAVLAKRKGQESRHSPLGVLANVDASRVATVLLAIIIIIEIGALARWISYPASPTEIYGDSSWRLAELESALFHTFGLLSPILVALIAFSFLYKWFMLDLLRKLSRVFSGSQDVQVKSAPPSNMVRHSDNQANDRKRDSEVYEKESSLLVKLAPITSKQTTRMPSRIILISALVVSPLLMIYPHLPGVNPSEMGVSVDEMYYVNWMTKLRLVQGEGALSVIANAFTINNGDRPLTLLLIKAIADSTASEDVMIIRYLPVALAPMLVFANYSLVRLALKSRQNQGSVKLFASIAALVAAFSPQIIVGEYAGFLANWIALVPAYFALYFMIRCWDSKDRRQTIIYSAGLFGIMTLVMLIHLYTWSHLLAVALVFVALSYAFSRRNVVSPKAKVLVLLLVVLTTFAVDYGKSLYFATPSATSADSALTKNIQPDAQGMSRWEQLYFTFEAYVGGYLSNPMLLLMALIWVVARADFARGLDRVVIAMLFMIAPPVLFGTVEFQTRVLFNTMIQVPALLAIYSFSGQSKNTLLRTFLIIAVVAVMATYGFRAMANLYLELPEGITLDSQFLLP